MLAVKVARIALTGDGWLDPSTVRLMYDLNNVTTDADPNNEKTLRPVGWPWSYFRKMRVLAGGTIIEDIDNYATREHISNFTL